MATFKTARRLSKRGLFLAASIAAALSACANGSDDRHVSNEWRQYDHNRPDPNYGGYYADRYYRESGRHHERRLLQNERLYRGQDGRYYCRQSDGSTGLVVGVIAGGILGNMIAPGGSETLGTLLGAGAGGLAGHSLDRNNVRCC
ncbi:MAG: hypothetical protein AB7V46_00605 [Thermomicrobiales bacterium]